MALEGAVVGAACGAVAGGGAVLIAHLGGRVAGTAAPLALVAAAAAAGAVMRGARRVSLASCARFADAALDRQDRVLSAYFLRDQQTPMARALVVDAAARARTLTPGGAVAPRKPKGLPALAVGAALLAAAALAPVRSRAARVLVAPPPAPAAPLARGALDVERDEVRRAAAAASALEDERLAKLAVDLDGTLRRLAAGKLSDGDALDTLAALQRQAAEAAAEAARDAKAFEAAEKALSAEAATRGAGEALTAQDGDNGERARAALGAAAADKPTETARALAAAARGVASALGQSNDAANDGEAQRRLARDGDKGNAAAPHKDSPGDRRLERLERNLDETAGACRDGDPSCRSQAERRGDDLGQLGKRGASAESLRRLERALGQMRERIGRGEMRSGGEEAMRGFERAARGDNGQSGEGRGQRQSGQGGEQQGDGVSGGEGSGQTQADANGDGNGKAGKGDKGEKTGKNGGDGRSGETGQNGKGGKGSSQRQANGSPSGEGDGEGGSALARAAALLAEREAEETAASNTPGEGQGNGAGGAPLGKRGEMQTRGHETEARVANGAGPNRAQVIGGAADRGFAQRDYARVFADYQAAVEDALATTAVPEGRRYVVRRYFDLIRPRPGKAHK